MTESRSQGSGNPSARESAMTPSRMATAGATVNTAEEPTVFLSTRVSMPISLARRQARTRKYTDWGDDEQDDDGDNEIHESAVGIKHAHHFLFQDFK